MVTFADLGVRFPLFDAPVDQASEFAGSGTCSLCGRHAGVCFELGIGCDVIVDCGVCGLEAGLDADDRADAGCRRCGMSLAFPSVPERLLCCFACLRAGHAAITKDTELGMVSWEQAVEGLTHGRPGLTHADFELVSTGSDWTRARVDQATLFEMIRTPTYSTIQGERWMFCCKRPMVFVGAWDRSDFAEQAPDRDGKTFLAEVLDGDVPGLWENQLHDETGIYVFRCGVCTSLRGHWDIA